MELNPNEAPECAVHGLLAPNYICGYVLVGARHCGFDGECQHKVEARKPATASWPYDSEGTPV